jgi:hypothetical protein
MNAGKFLNKYKTVGHSGRAELCGVTLLFAADIKVYYFSPFSYSKIQYVSDSLSVESATFLFLPFFRRNMKCLSSYSIKYFICIGNCFVLIFFLIFTMNISSCLIVKEKRFND